MTAALRKLALTTHVASSVGWFGSVAAFLALAIAGLNSVDSQSVRAAYLAMHVVTWFVIVPFCLASLATGFVESAITPWGLVRHYWIIAKLALTVIATILLFVHTQPIDRVAAVAARVDLRPGDLRTIRLQLIGDAAAALFVLFATTMLSVIKPWGMTPYGVRVQSRAAGMTSLSAGRNTSRYFVAGVITFVLLMILLHFTGHGPHRP